jgi:hypothetical protein
MSTATAFAELPASIIAAPVDCRFDPAPHFNEWVEALVRFRERSAAQTSADDSVATSDLGPRVVPRSERRAMGTLAVSEGEEIHADVEVTIAVIDGIFKGKINATAHVFLENHALVVGEINTPALTIQPGAIIEGSCYFQAAAEAVANLGEVERPGWQALKVGFAKVWRRRISQ